MLGNTLQWHGDFAGAIVAFRQALALDSSSLGSDTPPCHACEAVSGIAAAYGYMDQWPLSEQTARFFVAARPESPSGWYALSEALFVRGDFAAALAADKRRQELLTHDDSPFFEARIAIWTGDFDRAEALLRSFITSGSPRIRGDAYWWLTISQRYQGRLTEALRSVHETGVTLHRAQVLLESGRYGDAARTAGPNAASWKLLRTDPKPYHARHITWMLVHHTVALAAAGDTGRLASIADSMEATGRRSGYGRDHLLHHHVRALLFKSRGQRDAAVQEFRRAIWSTTGGYTRTNYELGRLLIELGRTHEAIPVLQAALRNDGQSSFLYVTVTELRALLARAFAETGPADSARVHRQWAERAWRNADPAVKHRIPELLNIPIAGRSPGR
jgi:tetratricopeptide (TPR) repeat protein